MVVAVRVKETEAVMAFVKLDDSDEVGEAVFVNDMKRVVEIVSL